MNSSKFGYISLVLATAFWGGNFIFGKLLSGALSPISLTFWRWFPAFIILLVVLYRPTIKQWDLIKRHLGVLVTLSILGVILFSATLYEGLKTTSTLNASLYLAVVPVFVLVLNRLFFRDHIRPIMWIGAMVSLVGVLWLLSHGDIARLQHLELNSGDLWAIASAASWALYCCVIRLRPAGLSNAAFLTALVGVGVLVLLPLFVIEILVTGDVFIPTLSLEQWGGVVYLIIGPSVLSYAFWNFGMSIVGSNKGAVMTNFTPLFAAIFGILILNEQVQTFHLVSAGLIVLGIVMCNLKIKNSETQDNQA